jgi:type IV pilus assembly protein PilW
MKKQLGFSLVELMIAALITAFLMASLFNIFLTTNKSVILSQGLAQNQETGRFTMDYLSRFIRQAGFTVTFDEYTPPLLVAESLDAASETPCPEGACSENNPDDAHGDRLAISYVTADAGSRSCTGSVIAAGLTVANVFWVSNDEATEFELRCRTYNYTTGAWIDAAVSLVDNVESFEFQIGVSDSETSRNASKYINLETFRYCYDLPDDLDPASPLQKISMNQVRSIRIGILTSSQDDLDANKAVTNATERKYSVLDGPIILINDANLRQIFSSTIELPNMIEASALN